MILNACDICIARTSTIGFGKILLVMRCVNAILQSASSLSASRSPVDLKVKTALGSHDAALPLILLDAATASVAVIKLNSN